MIELPVAEGSSLAGLSLAEMYNRFQIRLLVCAVEHGDEVRIPDGEYRMRAGDRLHIAASHKDLEAFLKQMESVRTKSKKSLFVEPEELVTILHFSLAHLVCR